MIDETESLRRQLVNQINLVPGSREALEAAHGQVWDTQELQRDFEVLAFASPVVVAKRRMDLVKGSLFFQHSPRFFYGFEPHNG